MLCSALFIYRPKNGTSRCGQACMHAMPVGNMPLAHKQHRNAVWLIQPVLAPLKYVAAEAFVLAGVCLQLPIVTRTYVTMSFLTTAGCALEVSSCIHAGNKQHLHHDVMNFFRSSSLSAPLPLTAQSLHALTADHHTVQCLFQCQPHLQKNGSVALADKLLLLRESR